MRTCPSPTLSTTTTAWPAASHSAITSAVCSATPPRAPRVGLPRMYARLSRLSCSMRVCARGTSVNLPTKGECVDPARPQAKRTLSPRMDPPPMCEEGSTGTTATLTAASRASNVSPNRSMNVDFPAPGGPATPSRMECGWPRYTSGGCAGDCAARYSDSRSAWARWSARVLSTSVMALDKDRRSPANTPRASSIVYGAIVMASRCDMPRVRWRTGRRRAPYRHNMSSKKKSVLIGLEVTQSTRLTRLTRLRPFSFSSLPLPARQRGPFRVRVWSSSVPHHLLHDRFEPAYERCRKRKGAWRTR